MDQIRVVLADDHSFVRKGIRQILGKAPDIEVIGEAENGAEALSLVELLDPDVLLLDVEMPVMNGIQVARQLKEISLPVRVLVISAHDDRQYILEMLDCGVAGYLTKEEVPQNLVRAVREIAKGGENWVSQRVAARIGALR
jgi:DNA-binding NarL/FixJ family response regulator